MVVGLGGEPDPNLIILATKATSKGNIGVVKVVFLTNRCIRGIFLQVINCSYSINVSFLLLSGRYKQLKDFTT